MDDASTPEPSVLLMIGLSLGLWGLLALGIISAWTRQVGPEQTASHKDAPPPAMPRHALPQLVSIAGQTLLHRPIRTKVKVARKRRWPVVTVRVFKTSMH
jgi:hypothetical protein